MNDKYDENLINEILQDFSYLYLLILVTLYIDDDEYKQLLDFLCFYSMSIFSCELLKTDIVNATDFGENTNNILKGIRNEYIKDEPKVESELIYKLNGETGVDFNNYVFDIVITKNQKNSELIAINYPYFLFSTISERDREQLNTIKRIPVTILKVLFDVLNEEFDSFNEDMQAIAKATTKLIKSKIDLKRFSFSSYELFKNTSLSDEEKYYILYRFTLVSIGRIIDTLQPLQFKMDSNNVPKIDTNNTAKKIKAIIIETIFRDSKELQLPITDTIVNNVTESIADKTFFSLNRKLRNNLHYKETNTLSDDERKVINTYQPIYFDVVYQIFLNNLKFNIQPRHKFFTAISKLIKPPE